MKRGGMNVNLWSLGIWILIEIVHPVLFGGGRIIAYLSRVAMFEKWATIYIICRNE